MVYHENEERFQRGSAKPESVKLSFSTVVPFPRGTSKVALFTFFALPRALSALVPATRLRLFGVNKALRPHA